MQPNIPGQPYGYSSGANYTEGGGYSAPSNNQVATASPPANSVQLVIKQLCGMTVDAYKKNLHAMVDEGVLLTIDISPILAEEDFQ